MAYEVYWRKGPNIAVLAMLAVPLVGLMVGGLEAFGVPLQPGAAGSVLVASFASLVAAAALAARLEIAPAFSAGLLIAAWAIGGGSDCVLIMSAGVGLAFWRREVFDQRLDWDRLVIRVVKGVRVFIKDSPGAARRAATGSLMCIVAGIYVGLAMAGMLNGPPRPLVAVLMGGVVLLASSVAIPDENRPK
ncbi:MAG: hypothetical protein ACI9WU_002104 [Myxococcota bacterium]|jgi:hypothetical protein